MSAANFIEPSLADAPAVRLDVAADGSVSYLVHGIVRVGSIQSAQDLLTDRRKPRQLAPPVLNVYYGEGVVQSMSRDDLLARIEELQQIQKTHNSRSPAWQTASELLAQCFAEMLIRDRNTHPRRGR